ncbi:hypothetical protein DVH24_012969 [Malus domestica]|uniref:Uncharacterized protein n=1 Tax=Malus domestica TaxID=3750 RepID=A0A498HUN5_MALDO|nr:hypothetical protein DVH24_012969 [Malus domestica]
MEPEEHQTSDKTVRGRKALVWTTNSAEWAVQSLLTQLPLGKDKLDLPKSVRSNRTMRSFLKSCMCMAETPIVANSCQLPPAAWFSKGLKICLGVAYREELIKTGF